MSEQPTVPEENENPQKEEQTSQTEQPYKQFTEQEWKEFMDSTIKRSYNQGKAKFVKDAVSEFGIEAETYEDALSMLKESRQQGKSEQSDKTSSETEQLRALLKQKEEEAQKAVETLNKVRLDQSKSTQYNQAMSELNKAGKMVLDNDSARILFENSVDIMEENGQLYASKDGIPLMDDSGNRKSLANAYVDFLKDKKLFVPNAQGTGGATASGVSASSKPKFSEFTKLSSGRAKDQVKAAEVWNLAKEIGWDEQDSPKTFRR